MTNIDADLAFKKDIYAKYQDQIALSCKKFHWLIRRETVSQSDLQQAVWARLLLHVDFAYEPNRIRTYIKKCALHECVRVGARSQMIRIPYHKYYKVCQANMKSLPEKETKTILAVSTNRFVEKLEDDLEVPASSPENSDLCELKTVLREVLKQLSPREQLVISLRFGLDDLPTQRLESLGHMLNCTRENVRQIEERAIRRLRQKLIQAPDISADVRSRLLKVPRTFTASVRNSTTPRNAEREMSRPVKLNHARVNGTTLIRKVILHKKKMYNSLGGE